MILALAAATAAVIAAGCERAPLLAPSGSTITLTTSTVALPLNGTTTIVAQVLEPAGTAPHSGTVVSFTTSLGSIQPATADTDASGRVTVTFNAGGASGTATILASSGGASVALTSAVKIAVGAAAVSQLTLSAAPGSLPAFGGSTTITARVLDAGGNALGGVPVSFTSDFGSIAPGTVVSDGNGTAQATLVTTLTSKVTATAGVPSTSGTTTTAAQTATLTVSVSAAATLTITPPSTPPSAGLPATFTFAVAVPAGGSAVRSLDVNWGDGTGTSSLGPVSGTSVQSHVFAQSGTYTVRATLTDAAGNVSAYQSSVTVIPVSRPVIVITPSPQNPIHGNTVNVSIQVSTVQGLGVIDTMIDFGDGQSSDFGGLTSTTVPHVYNAAGQYTITVTVTDSTGQTTIGKTFISVS
ncbi:MAG: PKD domain-containing protein [Acidobacteriota bacterium]